MEPDAVIAVWYVEYTWGNSFNLSWASETSALAGAEVWHHKLDYSLC